MIDTTILGIDHERISVIMMRMVEPMTCVCVASRTRSLSAGGGRQIGMASYDMIISYDHVISS